MAWLAENSVNSFSAPNPAGTLSGVWALPSVPVTLQAARLGWPGPQVIQPPFLWAVLQPAPSSARFTPSQSSLTPLPVQSRGSGQAPGRGSFLSPSPFPLGHPGPSMPGTLPFGPSCLGPGGPLAQWPQGRRWGYWVHRSPGFAACQARGLGRSPTRASAPPRGRGRVLRQRFRLGFRPRGAGRARGAPRRPWPITARPGLPAANHGPALLPCSSVSFVPGYPGGPRRGSHGPAPGLRPCNFRPARTGLCARDRVLGVCTRVCAGPAPACPGALGARRQVQAYPWSAAAPGTLEGLANAPEKLLLLRG